MKIGIAIAMDKEFSRVAGLLDSAEQTVRHGKSYTTGRIGRNDVVMVQCGIGKVNAALWTGDLVDGFAPDVMLSTGVAGGASVSLEVGNVVVSTQSCFHDLYCGEELERGQLPGMPARFTADAGLVAAASSLDCDARVVPGLIVTGDWFVDSREKMRSILDLFPDAMAVDMESAAIAQVCHQLGVPFASFRIISDIPLSDHKASQYFDFWDRLADSSFGVTKALLEGL